MVRGAPEGSADRLVRKCELRSLSEIYLIWNFQQNLKSGVPELKSSTEVSGQTNPAMSVESLIETNYEVSATEKDTT